MISQGNDCVCRHAYICMRLICSSEWKIKLFIRKPIWYHFGECCLGNTTLLEDRPVWSYSDLGDAIIGMWTRHHTFQLIASSLMFFFFSCVCDAILWRWYGWEDQKELEKGHSEKLFRFVILNTHVQLFSSKDNNSSDYRK